MWFVNDCECDLCSCFNEINVYLVWATDYLFCVTVLMENDVFPWIAIVDAIVFDTVIMIRNSDNG